MAPAEAGELCPTCEADLPRLTEPFCQTCAEPFHGRMDASPERCAYCAHRRLYFEAAICPCISTGLVRELIHNFKYNGRMQNLKALVSLLREVWMDERLCGERVDAIVPVPLHWLRQRVRGFNQAALLARGLGKSRGVPVWSALVRRRHTGRQTQLTRRERLRNLRRAFDLRWGMAARVPGARLLLVDDVYTTGTTVNECAKSLRRAGAEKVWVATVARAYTQG